MDGNDTITSVFCDVEERESTPYVEIIDGAKYYLEIWKLNGCDTIRGINK